MTDIEIADAIYDSIEGYVTGTANDEKPLPKGLDAIDFYHSQDTMSGFFVDHSCTCGGHAAAYTMLMHIMGQKCAGIHCDAGGGGHIVPIVKLDGELYIIDSGNRIPKMTYQEANSKDSIFTNFDSEQYNDILKQFK